MIIQFRNRDSKRKGWGSISNVDMHGAKAWLAAEHPDINFELREKPAPVGRPKGSHKPDAKRRRIFARINAEQSDKFDRLTGETDTDKLRGLLDKLP